MFIVFYGVNNLGKTTQAKLLVERLRREGVKAEYVKYPVYALSPSGPLIDEYLRGGNPHGFSPREFQLLQALNRTHYEPTLREKLSSGTMVVAEDYVGTGIAWGVGTGVLPKFLKTVNSHLLKEDIAFHFTGKRFVESAEETHAHEQDAALMARVAAAHELLAKEYGWIPIPANDPREAIHERIWKIVHPLLSS